MKQSLNKLTISSIFEKENHVYTKDALFSQDILRYFLHINQDWQENKPFRLRDLQLWIVENNAEISEQYHGYKGRPSHIVNSKKFRINRTFTDMIVLGLIKKLDSTSAPTAVSEIESLYVDSILYVYTKFGILLNLIIHNLNLEREISIEKDQNKIKNIRTRLDMVNNAIFQLVDSTLPIGDEYPSSNVFYKSFYKRVHDEGYFNKIVTSLGEICQYTEADKFEGLIQEFYIDDFFTLKNNDDRKILLKQWSDTLEDQCDEIKQLFLYQQKLIIERRFEYNAGYFSRDYERKRFEHKADNDKIILEGTCKKCQKQTVVMCFYMDYRRRSSGLDGNDLMTFDCQKCESQNCCIIHGF